MRSLRHHLPYFLFLGAFVWDGHADAAGSGSDRMVGSGISYAAPTRGLIVNPAALADGGAAAVEGLYRFEESAPFAAIVSRIGAIGLGADYRKEGDEQVFEGGFAFKVGAPTLGFTFRHTDSSDLDGDAGLALDFTKFRLAAVARGIEAGVDRVDAGLGIKLDVATVEFNYKRMLPFSNGYYFYDAGIAANVGKAAVGVGYDFYSISGISEGKLHADVALALSGGIAITLSYRPHAQEWSAAKWAAGARFSL